MVAPYQEALRPFDALDVIPKQWLHMTLHGVGHVSEVTDRERDAVVASVRSQLAALDDVPITFRSPGIDREGIAIEPTDPQPMRTTHRAVAAGTAEVIPPGQATSASDTFWPHVSLAYANATAGTREIRAALDAVDLGPITTTVQRVTLIEMHRDHRMYEWRPIEHVRLGAT